MTLTYPSIWTPSLWTPQHRAPRFGSWWRKARRFQASIAAWAGDLRYRTGGHLAYSPTNGGHLIWQCAVPNCYSCKTPAPVQVTVTVTGSVECSSNSVHGNPDGTYCLTFDDVNYSSSLCAYRLDSAWSYTHDGVGSFLGYIVFFASGGVRQLAFNYDIADATNNALIETISGMSCSGNDWVGGSLQNPDCNAVSGALPAFYGASATVSPGC